MAKWVKITIVDSRGECYTAKVNSDSDDGELERDILKQLKLDQAKYCIRCFPRRDDGSLRHDDALVIDRVDFTISGEQE